MLNNYIQKFFRTIFNIKIIFYKFLLSDIPPQCDATLNCPVLFLGKGKILCEDNVIFGYFPSPYYYSNYSHIEARNPLSIISIGKGTILNNNCVIIAENEKIKIGKNCLIGYNFNCVSSDFHSLEYDKRGDADYIKRGDINIGNNVFIGSNVTILKNVSIGDNCSIGSNSVVTKSFPENSIIAGNPAKIIRTIVSK